MTLRAIDVPCRYCGAEPGTRCNRRDGQSHPSRAKRAVKTATAPNYSPCECRNHMGAAKAQHKTREAAVMWAVTAAKRQGIEGMRVEFYECPTSACWHVRTAKRETA